MKKDINQKKKRLQNEVMKLFFKDFIYSYEIEREKE